MIETTRLRLVPYTREHAEVLERGPSRLGRVLEVEIPDGWPEFPEAYSAMRFGSRSHGDVWGTYLFLLRHGSLVGSGGYKGEPRGGSVEIGYEIAPAFRNQGFATEATQGMVDHAFSHAEIEAVEAHTLGERNASVRVLEKLGFTSVETIQDPDEGDLWRWRVTRSDWREGGSIRPGSGTADLLGGA